MPLLRELFYFDKESMENTDSKLYSPRDDESPMQYDDTRKTKLTLRAINKIRKANELHQEESEKDLVFVRQMYGAPPAEEAI